MSEVGRMGPSAAEEPDPGETGTGASGSPRSGGALFERLGLRGVEYPIPEEGSRWTYMLGGLTAFLLGVLVVTGLYLSQFYDPSPLGAHESVLYIIARAPLGDWVRSLHYWSAGAVVVTVTAHLAYVFWRRSYTAPREVTWWAGVAMAGAIFLLIITGTVLRYDQEGYEALAHFVTGGELTGPLGRFFTEGFTVSTPLLSRIYTLHVSLLPLLVAALTALHFWLIRHLGIHADSGGSTPFRSHLVRLTGLSLLLFAGLGILALIAPEGLGYPPVPGAEVTKPFWPVLWIYGLENLLGMWGMVIGPVALFAFLIAVPLLDREREGEPGRHGAVGWIGTALALVVLGLWLYGFFGEARQHLGM